MSMQSPKAFYDLPAPAKINLFLHIVGRRPDGYHLLQSVFQLVDWSDRLHFEHRADGRLVRHDLGEKLPQDDLILRAARALQQATGCSAGADISVDKQLPWGAGMGGGSSDAATTLLALNRLWGLNLPRSRLLEIGLALGADVPFFVGGRNAFVEGIGERLTPVRLPRQWFAIVKPAAAIVTKELFAHPLLVRNTEPVILTGSLDGELDAADWAAGELGGEAFGRNDMQPPAQECCPDVAQAARWLESRFGNSRMTGSGSAVFSRAGTGETPVATFPAESLPAGWVGRLCRGLERHPLVDWASG